MTVSANYICSTDIVTVNWNSVFADMYRATVVDSTGASSNCTSTSTSCQIPTLKCGETYRVYVTAISGACESVSNTSTSFQTGEQSRGLMWELQMCICLSVPF